MNPYLRYAAYVIRHCWYVRKMCWKNGLYWQGLVHDLSKWRPSEFIPYAQYFYWSQEQKDAETFEAMRIYGVAEAAPYGFFVSDRFNVAWLHHQKRNKHHWQYWVMNQDDGRTYPIKMPEKYVKEMLCDWWGASVATGNGGNSKDWYEKVKAGTQLHSETRAYFEKAVHNSPTPYLLPSADHVTA
jgi:hypothetical protein